MNLKNEFKLFEAPLSVFEVTTKIQNSAIVTPDDPIS